MTGLKSYSRPGLSALDCSYRGRGLHLDDQGNLIATLLVVPSPSKPVSDSQPIWQDQLSWVHWLQATLLGMGCLYAISSMAGEYLYASGFSNRYVVSAVSDLRDAAQTFPLNYQFRKGSAQYLTAVAVDQKNPEWTKAALSEIYAAIDADPTSADLLNSMRVFELELGNQPTHVAMYDLLAGKKGMK